MAVNPSAVTTQPTSLSRRKEVENIVRGLDPHTVLEWSEQEVIDNYLKPTGFDYLSKIFMEQHVTGAVLMVLEERHLKEMKMVVVGERVKFLEFLRLLKKHRKDADRSKALWTATTPVTNCAYHEKCGGFCFHLCCPCCVPTTEWRVTGQGIRWRKNPASIDCCGEVETQLIDFRFLKDLEFRKDPKFLCCCLGSKLLLYADDKDTVHGTRQSSRNIGDTDPVSAPIAIYHPDSARAESIIRNAWADIELVAD